MKTHFLCLDNDLLSRIQFWYYDTCWLVSTSLIIYSHLYINICSACYSNTDGNITSGALKADAGIGDSHAVTRSRNSPDCVGFNVMRTTNNKSPFFC